MSAQNLFDLVRLGLNKNQMLIIQNLAKNKYPTKTSAILSISEDKDIAEATIRFNFNSLANKGLIDQDKVILTPLGWLVLRLKNSDGVHSGFCM